MSINLTLILFKLHFHECRFSSQMRTDSLQDISYGGGDRFSSLPKQFPFDMAFRHRSGSEDLAKELIYGKDGALLPNKPSGPFSLGRFTLQTEV